MRADDRDRTGDLHLGKVARYQLRHVRMRAPGRHRTCGPLLTRQPLCQLSYGGAVSSARFERTLASISGWCLCRLGYEDSGPQRGVEPRASRLRGGRSCRLSYSGLAGIPGFEPGCSGFRARRVCQFPHIPSSTGGGNRTRTSLRSQGLSFRVCQLRHARVRRDGHDPPQP